LRHSVETLESARKPGLCVMKPIVAICLAVLVVLGLAPAGAPASEWDDYLDSAFQNFVWDEEVRTGYEAYAKQDYAAAAEALRTAIAKGCKDPVVVFRVGYALRATGKHDEASGYFKAATQQFATSRPEHRARAEAHLYLAEFYLKHGQYDEAEWELEHATHLRENFTEAYLLHGDLFVAQGKYHFATEQYKRAHETAAENVQPLMNLSIALFRDGKFDGAKAAVEKARLLEPENERVGLMAATLAIAQNDLNAAHDEYVAIRERDARSTDALLGLGYVAWRRGKFDQAAKYYAAILELDPTHVEALYGLGLAEAKLGDTESAIKRLRRVVTLKPDHKNARHNLGSLYQNTGKYELAIEQYAEVIRLDPDDKTPLYNLGVIFIQLRRYAEAQEYLEQAVEAFGQDTRWGRAAQQLLDLVIQLRQDRPVEIEKEIERLGHPGRRKPTSSG